MQITKTTNRDVQCNIDIDGEDGFKGVIIIEREAPGPVRQTGNRKWSHDAVSLSDAEFTKSVKSALRALQYSQMAAIVNFIHDELDRRNPIGVNLYTNYLELAYRALMEVSGGELGNATSECGPREVTK